jgi:hypothetical protein
LGEYKRLAEVIRKNSPISKHWWIGSCKGKL